MPKKVTNTNQPTQVAESVTPVDIPEYLKESYYKYLSYITAGRVCCSYMDGFLNIYRRTLYAATKVCKNHFVKASTLNAYVSGHYSPHGESPTATISMVSNGFLDIVGSNENNMGVEHADASAPRYIEVKLNPIAELIFLNSDLLPYVDYVQSELSTVENVIEEPTFLPVLLPGMYTAIADSSEFESYMEKGLKVIYPRYNIITLFKYVINYLETGVFDRNLLKYQYHNLIKDISCDDQVTFEEEFDSLTNKDDEEDIYHIVAKAPFLNMPAILKDIPYVDLTTVRTDITFPAKYFRQLSRKLRSRVRFNTFAYRLINNDFENCVLMPYSIRHSILSIIHNLKHVLFPRFFEDKIQKTKEEIEEHELLKIVHDKYVVHHIPFDQLTDEEQKCAGRHRVNKFMKIDDKLQELKNLLNEYIQRSKNIDGEILNLYKTTHQKVHQLYSTYLKDEGIEMLSGNVENP